MEVFSTAFMIDGKTLGFLGESNHCVCVIKW